MSHDQQALMSFTHHGKNFAPYTTQLALNGHFYAYILSTKFSSGEKRVLLIRACLQQREIIGIWKRQN